MSRCGPLRPLIMLRAKGLAGPLFQNLGGGLCGKGVGNWIGFQSPPDGVQSVQYDYLTPPSAFLPVAPGTIQQPDDTPAALFMHVVPESGAITIRPILNALQTGDVISINGNAYTLQRGPDDRTVFFILTVTPITQLPDGNYEVIISRP